jgi:hypothetical protein
MAPGDMVSKYNWVKETTLEAWTVAVVERRGIDEVLQTYGADRDRPAGELTFLDIDELRDNRTEIQFYVQVVSRGEHAIAIENDGYTGSLPEVARRCSAGGARFFSIYWNVNAFGLVTQAVDGVVTAQFEVIAPFEPEEQSGERRPAWAIGPETDIEIVRQTSMAHLERQTGVVVDPGWLRTPLPTYRIPDPHWLYRDVEGADRI